MDLSNQNEQYYSGEWRQTLCICYHHRTDPDEPHHHWQTSTLHQRTRRGKWNLGKVGLGPDMDTSPTPSAQSQFLHVTVPPYRPHCTVCSNLARFRLSDLDLKVCSPSHFEISRKKSFNDSMRRRVWHVPTGQNGQDLIGFIVLWRCECRWLR